MNPLFSPYVLIMMGAGFIGLLIVGFVWPYRHRNSEAVPLLFLLAGIVEWITAALLGLLDQNLLHKLLWAKVEYIGVISVPLAVLCYLLFHSGLGQQLTLKRLLLLALIPMATLVLAWSNEWHGLIWAHYVPYLEKGLTLSSKVYGPGFWVYWVYSYLLLLTATALTVRIIINSARLFQWQSLMLGIGILAPWVGNLLYILQIDPLKNLDLTPLAFSITGIMLATGMVRWRLFDLKPIAYASVIKGMTDGLIILDKEDRIIDLNPATLHILGLNIQKIIGKNIDQALENILPSGTQSLGMSEKRVELELAPDGDKRDYVLNSSPILDKRGKLIGKTVFLQDQTESKRLEAKLQRIKKEHAEVLIKESEARYREIYENAQIGIYRADSKGQILEANPALAHMLGYADPRSLRHLKLKKKGVQSKSPGAPINKALDNTGEILNLESKWTRKNGLAIFVLENVKVVLGTDGKILYYDGIVEDITTRRTYEEEIRRTANELRARNEELERFNKAMVGRELRMIELKKQIGELTKKMKASS